LICASPCEPTYSAVILKSRALARRLEGWPQVLVAHLSRLAEDGEHLGVWPKKRPMKLGLAVWFVMPGLVPGIHVLTTPKQERRGWPGRSPAMTESFQTVGESLETLDAFSAASRDDGRIGPANIESGRCESCRVKSGNDGERQAFASS
jgi:hypothetical protein